MTSPQTEGKNKYRIPGYRSNTLQKTMEKTLKVVGLLLTIRKEILTPTQALGSSGRKKEQERAREAREGDI